MDNPFTQYKQNSNYGFLALTLLSFAAVILIATNLLATESPNSGEPDNFERAKSTSYTFTVENSFPDPVAPLELLFTVPQAEELLLHGVTSEEAAYVYVQRRLGDVFCIGLTNPYDGTLNFSGYGLKLYSGDKLLARGYKHRSITLYGLLLRLQ